MKILDLLKESNNYSTRWIKYFEVYDQIFEKFRDKKITFVEVGVLNGGSLEMWKKYFHPESRIIGIDLNPECKTILKEQLSFGLIESKQSFICKAEYNDNENENDLLSKIENLISITIEFNKRFMFKKDLNKCCNCNEFGENNYTKMEKELVKVKKELSKQTKKINETKQRLIKIRMRHCKKRKRIY